MNFIVALQPEARPLIEKFKLKKKNGSNPFPVFENENHRLIISGIGRMKAAATGYLLSELGWSSSGNDQPGYCGYGLLPIGTPFLANRFHSQEKKLITHPQLSKARYPVPLANMDAPEKSLSEPIGYDMEAHAILFIAYTSITRELVQVIKVISDNLPRTRLESFESQICYRFTFRKPFP